MVLRGDLDGFGALMQRGLDEAVRDAMRRAVERYAADCLHASLGEGDALLLVDDRILSLIKAARRIMEEISEVPGSPRMRIAIAAGPVAVRERGEEPPAIEGGNGRAGRLAYGAARAPGRDLGDRGNPRRPRRGPTPSLRAEPVTDLPSGAERRADGAVNVRKPGSERARHLGEALQGGVVAPHPGPRIVGGARAGAP